MEWKKQNTELQNILAPMGIETVMGEHIYKVKDTSKIIKELREGVGINEIDNKKG